MVERHYLIGTYFFSEIIFGGYNIINNLDSPKKEGSNATPYNTYGNNCFIEVYDNEKTNY